MSDKLDGIIISEVLADNAGGSAIDTDNDGNTNKSDEFIELQNSTGSSISLDGFEVWSEKNGLLYAFGSGDSIAAGDTATIVGNYSGTVPSDYYDGGVSEGTDWIPDGEGQKYDSIFLVNSATGEYVVLSYGNPPRSPTLPSSFPGTTRIGAGETISSTAPNGTAFSRDANGDFQEATPTPDDPGVPCFVNGSKIRTSRGDVPIEWLAPGDKILTRDNGYASLRAIRSTKVSRAAMRRNPDLIPITLPAGALGNNRPLRLSASHRVLIRNWSAELFFGTNEVLVAAGNAVGFGGITRDPCQKPVTYFHLLFDRHEIIRANGCWVESLFFGDVTHRKIGIYDNWNLAEGLQLESIRHMQTARLVLKSHQTQVLFDRARQAPPEYLAAAA